MKKLLISALVFTGAFLDLHLQAQNKNMSLLGQLPYPSATLHGDLNDVWGYVDSLGNEYAIVGLEKGVSIVDVTDPQNLSEVFYVAGVSTIWRDIKTWNKHAYITNEGSGGLMIIDMSVLPGQIQLSDVSYFIGSNFPFIEAHNLYIDENGVAYIFGSNYSKKGAIFLDLTNNPKLPQEVGVFDSLYLHDGMVRGDTLWGAAIYAGQLMAVDVSNKSNPVVIGSQFTADFFAHNCWVSDNGQYVFTTDEKSGAYVGSYDVSDILNIRNLDNIRSNPGSGVIPHNTHVIGDFLVTSYYKDGITIVDATHPEKMVQVGNYDTSPLLSGSGFSGSWGAYPWLPSGNVLASDIENGLFVLGANYVRGVYIEGIVRKFADSAKIPSVKITSVTTGDSLIGGLNGFYDFAFADSGIYRFVFEKPGYLTDTLDVFLHSGQLFIGDIYLRSEVPLTLTGRIHDVNNGNLIADAGVYLESKFFIYDAKTNASGYFEVDSVFEGSYEITSGKWGYVNDCETYSITAGDSIYQQLQPGIYDDFTLDFGWTAVSNGSGGSWERERLRQQVGFFTLDFPTEDEGNDCSGFSMVTEHSFSGDHDVDGGWNYISSPVIDASGFSRPVIDFSFWFRNDAPTGQDDTLIFSLVSEGDTLDLIKVHNLVNLNQSQWIDQRIELRDLPVNSSEFYFLARTGDFGSNNLLEAGIDYFTVSEGLNSISDVSYKNELYIYPNPASDVLYVSASKDFNAAFYRIFDTSGKIISEGKLIGEEKIIPLGGAVPFGLNLIQLTGEKGEIRNLKFIRN